MDTTIAQLAKVIRSKNAGPFELTIDLLFANEESYDLVKSSRSITKETVVARFGLKPEEVLELVFFDEAKAIKITLPRTHPSGSPGERDTYGAQQYAPILHMPIFSPELKKNS